MTISKYKALAADLNVIHMRRRNETDLSSGDNCHVMACSLHEQSLILYFDRIVIRRRWLVCGTINLMAYMKRA